MAAPIHHKDRSRGGWVKMTPAEAESFSAENKQAIKDKVDKLVERYMKPAALQRHGRKAAFGDVQDIYTKWHGNSLVVIAKRRGGRMAGRDAEDFETKSGRLTHVGSDLFDVSYFRHTSRWWTIHYGCTLKTALKYLQKPSPLWPW
jgi:hypothetical protein